MPNYQGVWSLSTQFQNAGNWPNPPLPVDSNVGVFQIGYTTSGYVNNLEYIDISTTANAEDFGDLNIDAWAAGGSSSSTRALFSGFQDSGGVIDNISYIF